MDRTKVYSGAVPVVRRSLAVWAAVVALVVASAVWSTPAGAASKPVPGFLDAVSCVNSTFCMAVGSQGVNNVEGLSEIWDGSAWTVQSVDNPAGASSVSLLGVACTAPNDCLAVGSYSRGGGALALAESWNGSTWTIQTVPLPTDDFNNGGYGNFNAVSCSSSGSCMAVGDYPNSANDNVALSEYWDGLGFAPESVPAAGAGTASLDAVSCPASTSNDCEALGWTLPSLGSEIASVLSEGWNSSSWTQQATPYPDGPETETYPSGISCVSPTACSAVGFGFVGSSPENAWAMQYVNGGWNTVPVATPSGATFTGLNAVSCGTNSAACSAVGDSNLGTLGERSTGPTWSLEATPNPVGSTQTILSGVSCEASSKPCEAVGFSTTSKGVQKPLAEVWSGSKWKIQTLPAL